MIALDTNILVYSHRLEVPFHAAAKEAVKGLAEGAQPWALPWPCIHEFLANATNAKIYKTPTPVELAVEQVDQWLASPSVVVLVEAEGYWKALSELVARSQVTGARIHDARLAALCLCHGVTELWTADRNFGRFVELRTRNPLSG